MLALKSLFAESEASDGPELGREAQAVGLGI
jgi:hypothetical protein